MEHRAVSSSTISSIAYDTNDSTLQIRFRRGGVFNFFNVPDHVWRGLMTAHSHGQYFHSHIRDRYDCRKIGQ